MRGVTCLVLVACGTTSSPVPATPTTRDPIDVAELKRHAYESLELDRPMDYSLPMVEKSSPRITQAELFHQLCVRDDHVACRIEAWLRDPSPEDVRAVYATVADECRGGDMMSCRALPPDHDVMRYPDLPGAMSRRADCGRNPSASCNLVVLRGECENGIPAACSAFQLNGPDTGRFFDLRDDACEAGALRWCTPNPNGLTFEGNERLCMHADACTGHAHLLGELWMFRSMRYAEERECQHRRDPEVCLDVAMRYEDELYPEPVPGRAAALRAWSCARLPHTPDERWALWCRH